MAGPTAYLLGEKPHPVTIVAALIVALAMAAIVLVRIDQWDWQSVLLIILAADIGAGLVSNATEATRARWRGAENARLRTAFLVVHLTLYPAALFFLTRGDTLLFGILATILLAKVMVFAAGSHGQPG